MTLAGVPPTQLAALAAVCDAGTFEAAARRLHVTPSAVSQRIRALESAAGRVLVRRTTPCRPTDAGRTLLRLARQTELLQDEAARELAGDGLPVSLAVAVNADSLATWFHDVLSDAARWDGIGLRLHVEDQAHSAELLRSGDVLAAVTDDPAPVQGCSVEPLGVLRYVPAAAPAFVERWRRGRSMEWGRMPVVVFNDKDRLQDVVLERHGCARPAVLHQVPTSADFHEAVRRGLGWAAVPEPQLRPDLEAGLLERLPGRGHVDVPLHWQRWRLDSPVLARLTEAVGLAARRHLRR
ncbi:LysR family transcriptional regulator ArgP [Nocardioides sp. SYSU DS0651]|uniref:LysR family transcriptional regulator ArgP n=1 Tax=Nocardioides sp. SYSU DS0651 TaxID=3415955 RepID=UPI003F4C5D59